MFSSHFFREIPIYKFITCLEDSRWNAFYRLLENLTDPWQTSQNIYFAGGDYMIPTQGRTKMNEAFTDYELSTSLPAETESILVTGGVTAVTEANVSGFLSKVNASPVNAVSLSSRGKKQSDEIQIHE